MKNIEGAGIHREPIEHAPTADDVRLENGNPLYHVLLDQSGAGVVRGSDAENARDAVRLMFDANPEAVLSCEGKTSEQAREILNAIEPLKQAA